MYSITKLQRLSRGVHGPASMTEHGRQLQEDHYQCHTRRLAHDERIRIHYRQRAIGREDADASHRRHQHVYRQPPADAHPPRQERRLDTLQRCRRTDRKNIRTPFYTALHTNLDGPTHVLTVNTEWHLFHAIRTPDGNWTPFGDVETEAGDIGKVGKVSIAPVGRDIHVTAVSQGDGRLWHTIRRADGTWDRFGDIESAAGEAGQFLDVASAGDGAELHVCVLAGTLHIHHSIRHSDGTWTPLASSPPIRPAGSDCTMINGELNLVRVRAGFPVNVVEHRVRNRSGVWWPGPT